MKLFEKDIANVLDYLKLPLVDNEAELELIFGVTPYKNPVDKKVFLRVLEECRKTYKKHSETIDLDITTEFKGKPGNVRATIHGLDDIKKYCKEGSLKDIANVEYMQKKFIKDKPGIKEEDYNVRLKVKTENKLDSSHYFVRSFNENYENKGKHYRYKKRFSFLTNDKLFRIDLTIIKSTKYFKGKYDFQKSFKKANILSNSETYEIEIEYVGMEKGKGTGIAAIDKLYDDFKTEKNIHYPVLQQANIYDPLRLGIDTEIFEEEPTFESELEYGMSPRFDSEENPILYMKYNESSKRYSQEDYRKLIGKSTMIRRTYFKDFGIDMKVFNTLMEYSKRNIFHAVISDIVEKIDEKTDKYIETEAIVTIYPEIGNTSKLFVPLKYLIGGYFEIEEDKINQLNKRPDLFNYIDDDGNIDLVEQLPELSLESSEGPSYAPGSPLPSDEDSTNSPQSPIYDSPDYDPDSQTGGAPTKKAENSLVMKLFEILEETVIHLSKIIYETEDLMSHKLKDDLIYEYRKLTGQRAKYFTFMGPQPVTLNMDGLDIRNPGSILVDFAVTEKADGERYELMIKNGSGYLINAKKEIIDTGCYFSNIKGDWLFDGEYITKDKFNEPIRLFMIFDVYWCNIEGIGIPKEAHTLPFIARDPDDKRSRKYILDYFTDNVDIIGKTKSTIEWEGFTPEGKPLKRIECPTDIRVKSYEFGYQTESVEEKVDSKIIGKDKYIQIFKSSRNILKKDKEGHYPYRIDGLIFLPTRLSVRGSLENVNASKISGTWNYNYKWKEAKENTIDFQIKVKKDIQKGEIKDVVQNYVDKKDGKRNLGEYKTVELFVGYKEIDDENIDYCFRIMDTFVKSTDTIQKFNINSEEDEKYNETNIPLVNGKMLCDNFEKTEINDGDLVEMRFNPNSKNGMYWEPIRLRKDKLKPQYFLSANNIWKTIKEPITEEMITGSDIIKRETSIVEKGMYYINNDDDLLVDSLPLRRFHNYIKSRLISGICSSIRGRLKIMDLSIGRGGDIGKYLETHNVKFLYGIDISKNVNEACKRFYTTNNKECKALIVRGDTSKNIQNLEFSDIDGISESEKEHTEIMTNIIYGKETPIPKKYIDIRQKYFGLGSDGFDIISSQFSMHYYFENKRTFEGFIRNLKENIKKGGYFIGSCYDGKKIFDYFKKIEDERIVIEETSEESSEEETSEVSEEIQEEDEEDDTPRIMFKDVKGNVVYKVEKKYDVDNFDYNEEDDRNMFGQVIDVYMDSIGQVVPEYLVNFDYFVKIMGENGFKPVVPTNVNKRYSSIFRKDNFDVKNIGSFKNIIEKIPEIEKTDPELNEKFYPANKIAGDYSLKHPLYTLSSFNNYFVFQKRD